MKKYIILVTFLHCSLTIGQNIQIDSLTELTNSKIEKIDNTEKWDEVFNYYIDNFTLDNASLKVFYLNNSVLKLLLEANNSDSKLVKSYYFENEKLIYSYSLDAKNTTPENENFVLKSYFLNNQLVYQYDNTDCGSMFSQDYLQAEGESILDEVLVIRSLIAANNTKNN